VTTEQSTGLFSRASRWGVRPGFNPIFSKRIILTNLLGFMFTINMSVSALAFLYFGHTKLAFFTFCFAFTELCWPLLNRAGHYTIARAGMLISSNVLGFLVSIALPGTGYNKGFYVMVGLPILLFDIRERGFVFLGFLLPLILYPVSEWIGGGAPFAVALSPEMASTIGPSITIIYVVLIFLMFYFLARENNIAEAQLEEQRLRSFASAKFAALGEMASGITHEINNPLTAINLHTQNLRFLIEGGEKDKDEALKKVDLLGSTVHRIARIVESMSTISREGSQDPLKRESLQRIVDDTTTFCSERFRKHDVKFTIIVPDHVTLECRAVQISQLLLNLLNNAFDAIEPLQNKWIKLEVSERSGSLRIFVTDSGPGILPELRQKIFDPFFTTKPAGKGTGLGLSLSTKIAQDHKGRLFLDNDHPNTRFIVEFPRKL
jgi:signal transduction histidine kinase